MKQYLVIVESPAKKSKISSFLNTLPNSKFIVDASFGHICQFKNGLKSIDIKNNFKPSYKIITTKKKVVNNLKNLAKRVDEVIIATDRDREGEAIGYHLIQQMGLSLQKTKRIYFNEITKKALITAFKNPTTINQDLYFAQQARSVLDLLIGYNISPVLWNCVAARLSAGRCQSPALRLISERENEIKDFKSSIYYKIDAEFSLSMKNKKKLSVLAEYKNPNTSNQLDSKDIKKLISRLYNQSYELKSKGNKEKKTRPPPPYITSTIQQDASSQLHLSPKQTMSLLQQLYEKGKITYMRTDNISVSKEFQEECKKFIDKTYKNTYYKHVYKSKTKNAQEAHECIRPVHINTKVDDIENKKCKQLFDLIRKRVIASFMTFYKENIYTYHLKHKKDIFSFEWKKTLEFGFKKLYTKKILDQSEYIRTLDVSTIQLYKPTFMNGKEMMTKNKSRFTEASLVKELEKHGIGRPSTFSNIVNTILTRKYVHKETKHKKEKQKLKCITISSKDNKLKDSFYYKESPSLKGKLLPTPLGCEVSAFLKTNFKKIMNYKFTNEINEKLDEISLGNRKWYDVVHEVYESFIHIAKSLLSSSSNKTKASSKTMDTLFSKDNFIYQLLFYKNYDTYYLCKCNENLDILQKVKIDTSDRNKIDKHNVDEYFKYPKYIGIYDKDKIYLKKGPYGLYVTIGKKNISIQDENITIEDIIQKLKEKNKNIIKEWTHLKILNGPYGPYIRYKNKNCKIPKSITKPLNELSLEECKDIVGKKNNYKKK